MKILVKAVAGSHLFGTNTPTSDKDFKGVFLPSADDILLGKFDQTVHQSTNKEVGQKNTKDDVDVEFYSLDKFLKMLYQGQTVALELLFTPNEYIIECHPLWKEIRSQADKLISKNCKAFIGYTKTQADRYGIRGSRLDTVSKWLEHLKKYPQSSTLKHIIVGDLMQSEHTELIQDKNGKELLQICGKKFGQDTKLEYIIEPLQRYHDEYGERSKLARLNQGVDFKALSHSIRVSMQAFSLLTTGKIQLPMAPENVAILKDVKAGKYDYLTVAKMIEEHLDKVLEAQKTSNLPDEPNLEAFQSIQKRIYSMVIKGEA